jgi:hypothetical protein
MKTQILTTSWQRSMGAMFKKSLRDNTLVFVYPHPAPRLFHTFYCPPLRILALNDEGEILFDEVIPPNRFVRLPSTRFVIETNPDTVILPADLQTLARNLPLGIPQSLSTGAIDHEVSLHKLMFALIADALTDLRRLKECCQLQKMRDLNLERLKEVFSSEERGQFINSAAFVLDFGDAWHLPSEAYQLARQVLQIEGDGGCLGEMIAAAVGGSSWKTDFPHACVRCLGAGGGWRPVLSPAQNLPPEVVWRYARPENHVFLCRKCVYKTAWLKDETVRHRIALGVWGARFEALHRWHNAAIWNLLPPEWDKERFPLWPEAYGGDSWETGSGAVVHVAPRPPEGVLRSPEHLARMKKCLGHPRTGRLPDAAGQKRVSLDKVPCIGETP